jgi:hypothetical protein
MPGIDQFIQSAVSELGIGEETARSGVGRLLGVIQSRAEPGDFRELLSSMPGAEALVSKSSAASASPGGALLGGVTSMLGGGTGSGAELLGRLQGTGLNAESIGPFVSKFLEFARSGAGEALIGRLLSGFPEVKALLG